MQQIHSDALGQLEAETFSGLGCAEHGVVVLRGARSWEAHERGFIELPRPEGTWRVPLAYDERGGPYAFGRDGNERTDLLLSLTDEEDMIACTWACVGADTPVMGLGVDLCSTVRFHERPHAKRRDLSTLLLTPHEQELVYAIDPEDPCFAKAALFAAKEAAFKATAAPLRRWYDTHDEQLRYEVRHFVMEEPGLERGTWRNGAAQAAMDRMGIAHVHVHWAKLEGMALVTALALRS